MAKQDRSDDSATGGDQTAAIQLPVPAPNPELFRHKATSDILRLLFDTPYETFTIRELSRLTEHSTYAIKSAVDVLEDNGLVTAESTGNRRPVGINRSRMSKPDDPIIRIPQPEFHEPIRTALDRLHTELEDVRGILVFGSVARGQADRQSDIDLWVLVAESRGEQHRANEIATELGQKRFGGERYEFHVMVESRDSAQGYADHLIDIFTDAITLYESATLRDLKEEVLTNA